ncbi:DUF3231 family protein [Metabacillus fastidiosus]|uniref:DUF3231 family protein n=1 Tax=Metabacillus fastidiosus TaxID=1458 RepID=UPI003D2737A0
MSNARLSSSELGALWGTYMQQTMSLCLIKYFQVHLQDEDIKVILEKFFNTTSAQISEMKGIFQAEKISLPNGFTDNDINLLAPPLFYDPFVLSFIYSANKMQMINLGFVTAGVARKDMIDFFTKASHEALTLHNESKMLMLEKGLYDRPPMIPYPEEVHYIEKENYLSHFIGEKRPLNVIEISEIHYNIERNYFALVLCYGLLQIIKDKKVKSYINKGKELSEKQIKFFNDLLLKEDLMGVIHTNMEVTDSTVSPFSDKLIVSLFHSLNSIDITLIGHALSLSMRTDLTTHYSALIAGILSYGKDGFDLMVERQWLEKPPGAPDRKGLANKE